ncbi:hypothetical protein [Neobacillus bataviensis]|uniref:hypothetical protein n=1 Tax=Neobacillus bataviensis TaxID=220685 RepID=UPI001CBCF561|nr:hypothetical protein [Neobacillus bataviensis]
MKNKTVISVFFLLVILGFAAYLDSPYSFINNNYAYSDDQPVLAQPVEVEKPENVPELVDKLEKTKKEDGYIIETYEEYEVYKDQNGKVIKSEPTGKTETLKYWDYKD